MLEPAEEKPFAFGWQFLFHGDADDFRDRQLALAGDAGQPAFEIGGDFERESGHGVTVVLPGRAVKASASALSRCNS